jgi:hypothetical protein
MLVVILRIVSKGAETCTSFIAQPKTLQKERSCFLPHNPRHRKTITEVGKLGLRIKNITSSLIFSNVWDVFVHASTVISPS